MRDGRVNGAISEEYIRKKTKEKEEEEKDRRIIIIFWPFLIAKTCFPIPNPHTHTEIPNEITTALIAMRIVRGIIF